MSLYDIGVQSYMFPVITGTKNGKFFQRERSFGSVIEMEQGDKKSNPF